MNYPLLHNYTYMQVNTALILACKGCHSHPCQLQHQRLEHLAGDCHNQLEFCTQDAQWITDFHIVLRRLEVLRAAMPVSEPAAFSGGDTQSRHSKRNADQADAESGRHVRHCHNTTGAREGPSSSAGTSHWGLKNVVVVTSRSAKKMGSWTNKFREQYVDKDYEVCSIVPCYRCRACLMQGFDSLCA